MISFSIKYLVVTCMNLSMQHAAVSWVVVFKEVFLKRIRTGYSSDDVLQTLSGVPPPDGLCR
jgi:hypothetical protein